METKESNEGNSLLPPWITCPWLEATPGSTMGSRRAKAVREWQGMRQKASAEPERRATAAEAAMDDFMVVVVFGVRRGPSM
jgi:hypothetical protein